MRQHFINAVITFVSIAAAIFFVVVKPTQALLARMAPPGEEMTRACPECLSVIPIAARRCAHCGSQVTPGTPVSPGVA